MNLPTITLRSTLKHLWMFYLLLSFILPFASGCSSKVNSPSRTAAALNAGEQRRIVVYGTSLCEYSPWVRQFEREISNRYPGKVELINSAKSGMGTVWGLLNVRKRVIDYKPDCLLMEFVINDGGLTVEQSRTNLSSIIDTVSLLLPACEIVLMTMNPNEATIESDHLSNQYQMVRDIAHERGLLLVDNYPDWLALREQDPAKYHEVLPDGVHPNAEGSARITTPNVLRLFGLIPTLEW